MILHFLRRVRESKIASSTIIMTLGNGLQQSLQLVGFVIVTRSLGSSQFGAFASVVAVVSMMSAFAGWGSTQLLVRRVAKNQSEFPLALCSGFVFLGLSIPPLFVISLLFIPMILGPSVPIQLIVLIFGADIIFAQVNGYAAACYQSVERPVGTLRVNIEFSATRLLAALLWVGIEHTHDTLSWAWYYFVASAIAGTASVWLVTKDLGKPVWDVRWSDWRDGLFFSLQNASFRVFRGVDRPLVATLSSFEAAGQYTAAIRIADGAAMPVSALSFSTYVRFFQHGAFGSRHSLRLALRLLPFALGLGLIGGLALVTIAPFAPQILGHTYAGTTVLVLLLTAHPALCALLNLSSDALVSSGHIGARTVLLTLMPFVEIALCFALVPSQGAFGGVLATLLAHVLLVTAAWSLIIRAARR